MSVICEKCGADYQVDPEKIKAEAVRFTCTACGQYVTVRKKDLTEEIPQPEINPPPQPEKAGPKPLAPVSEPAVARKTGIRKKMFILVAICFFAFAGMATYVASQLNGMIVQFNDQGMSLLKEYAERRITHTAYSVAAQVGLYLEANPNLTKENFMTDERFKAIAIQPVGKTGYTVVNEKGADGIWRTWAHINPDICAPTLDDMSKLEGPLGVNFPEFWKVLTGIRGNEPSRGYYRWQEKDGTFKDKYMATVNIKGTSFNIASTTYIDEFTLPMQRLEIESRKIARTLLLNVGLLVTLVSLILAAVAFFFANRLTSNIQYLSDVTDRISLGDLDTVIETRSKDELGVLTDSISRLQRSVNLSIQRLRK